MIKGFVRVFANPETGEVYTPDKKNPEVLVVGVEQVIKRLGSFAGKERRVAFIRGDKDFMLGENFKVGQVLDGTIIRKYSYEPQYATQTPVINPQTQEVALKNGKPYYMSQEFVDDRDAKDIPLGSIPVHTAVEVNAEAEAMAAQQF